MRKEITVAFYNVENFFDTRDDPATVDEEFTPSGELKWDETRYYEKIERIAEVFKGMGLNHTLPSVIGLAEIENRKVLEDLLEHRDLDHEDYGIIHTESRDVRGIDVALIYSKAAFKPEDYRLINFERLTDQTFDARDILYVWGKLSNGRRAHFFVNHWPSRRKGKEETEFKRLAAATALRMEVERITEEEEDPAIIIMGDFNDQPYDHSLRNVLKAGESGHEDTALVNLGWPIVKRQWGSVQHEGAWFLFDTFIVTGNLLRHGSVTVRKDRMFLYDEGEVLFKNPFTNKVKPNRTYVGHRYKGGYSDHLAVFIRLILE